MTLFLLYFWIINIFFFERVFNSFFQSRDNNVSQGKFLNDVRSF